MENELNLMIHLFESKIDASEKDYKEKHKEDFDKQKMNKHINRKLKKEINGIIAFNLIPSVQVLNSNRKI